MSEELVPIEPEVVDGEVVESRFQAIKWEEWRDPRDMRSHFRLSISDEWLHRADRYWVDLLDQAILDIKHIAEVSNGS